MKKLSREAIWSGVVLALLLLLAVASAIYQALQENSELTLRLSVASTEQEGARALWLWLEALGYSVSTAVDEGFALPPRIGAVMLLEPTYPVTEEEWETLTPWLERGGVLVVAGDRYLTQTVFEHFDFSLRWLDPLVVTVTAQTPLWFSPPPTVPATLQARAYLEAKDEREAFVTHFAVDDRPLLVSFDYDEGRVFLCTSPYLFSNAGLKIPGNASLVLNLLAESRSEMIWFDEWHHGERPIARIGPEAWLHTSAIGHALLYVAGVAFLAMWLHGQNFGRPVVPPQFRRRRAPVEYITAMANLHRRAEHRADTLRYYHRLVKRELGRRYHLDPDLRDAEYLAQLEGCDAALDMPALRTLLRQLHRADVNESEMLKLVHAALEIVQ